jgi:TolB-like protein/DNA-binding SARP family transcriptional activator/cytochrome c-type biogenesis protein CcmH/NrfG
MLVLRTFGGLSIEENGALYSGAAVQRKTLALLALLAAAGKNGLSRDKLIAYLWPESDAERGRNLLKQACFALRRDLREPELFLGSTELRLNASVVTSDVQGFEDALRRTEPACAVEAYAGPFLDGFYLAGAPEFERWVEAERARLKQCACQALETLATEASSRGDRRTSVEWWRRIAEIDRLNSHVALGLMNALVAVGDRAGALQFARVHESLLRQELDATPDEAVTTLARRLRDERGDSAPAGESLTATPEPGGAGGVAVSPRTSQKPGVQRSGAVVITGVAVIAAMVVAIIALQARPPAQTVAVLYFDNLSRDTADRYLADGFTEDIGTRLGQIERLVVKSRNAVRRYRGAAADDPASVGRALGVSYLVSGSVRRAGDHLRVTVELVQAASGTRMWGDQYDRTDADVLAVEEQVAGEVARHIAGTLPPTVRASLAARPTESLEAYDHLLRGNYYLAQRKQGAIVRAIQEYDSALRVDPRFTSALARVSLAHALLLWWGWSYPGVPAETTLARGWAAAEGALRLDSTSSNAWMARAHMLMYRYPRTYEGVKFAFERAIALDPANAEACSLYGARLRDLGEDSAAVAMFHRALALEPDRSRTLVALAETHWLNRRYQEARRTLDSAVALDPGNAGAYGDRSQLLLILSERESARRDAETALLLNPRDVGTEAMLAQVEARTGDTLDARTRLDRLLRERPNPSVEDGQWMIVALDALGQRDRALGVLERLRPRGVQLWSNLRYPEFDPLRSNPRFRRILDESRPPGAPR